MNSLLHKWLQCCMHKVEGLDYESLWSLCLLSLYPPMRSHMTPETYPLNPSRSHWESILLSPHLMSLLRMCGSLLLAVGSFSLPAMSSLSHRPQKTLPSAAKNQAALFFSGMEGPCPLPRGHFHVGRKANCMLPRKVTGLPSLAKAEQWND